MAAALHHIQLPGPRSLCGLPLRDPEGEKGAVCSSCLLLLSRLRRHAAALVKLMPKVAPTRPTEAWEALRGTEWADELNLDEFLARPNLDKTIDLKAFQLAVDPKSVDALIEEWRSAAVARGGHPTRVTVGDSTTAHCEACDWTAEGDDDAEVMAAARAHIKETTEARYGQTVEGSNESPS